MYLFYNLILVIVYPLFYFISLFVPTIKKFREVRRFDLDKLRNFPFKEGIKNVLWLHAASVGELDQARAIAKVIKEKNRNVFILQSIYSSSVTSKQLEDPNFDLAFHLPFDLPFAYRSIIQKFHPNILMILAWDTWPNLIRDLKLSGAKTYLACASLSEKSGRNKGLSRLLTKSCFKYLDGIFPSHEILESVFKPLIQESTIMESLGDTRFDAVLNRIENSHPSERFVKFLNQFNQPISSHKPILFGSTYPICESYLLKFLKENSNLKSTFWIFPHKWEDPRMTELSMELSKLGTVTKFSDLINSPSNYPNFILFDEMGILAFAYKYAEFAYVGGGFHNRIHNTIEPAAFGLALVTGKEITNAPEAIVMQKLGGLFTCPDYPEFSRQMKLLLTDQQRTREIGEKNRKFVLENRGASERIYVKVFKDAFS